MTLKFELGQDFCTIHLPTKFHNPINITHKRAAAAENIHLALLYATPVDNMFNNSLKYA